MSCDASSTRQLSAWRPRRFCARQTDPRGRRGGGETAAGGSLAGHPKSEHKRRGNGEESAETGELTCPRANAWQPIARGDVRRKKKTPRTPLIKNAAWLHVPRAPGRRATRRVTTTCRAEHDPCLLSVSRRSCQVPPQYLFLARTGNRRDVPARCGSSAAGHPAGYLTPARRRPTTSNL